MRPHATLGSASLPPSRSLSLRQWVALDWIAALLGFWAGISAFRGGAASPGLRAIFPALFAAHSAAPIIGVPQTPRGLVLACVFLASSPIAVRRRWPLGALAVVLAATALLAVSGRASLPGGVMLALAGYTAVTQSPRRMVLRVLVLAEAVLAGALLVGAVSYAVGAVVVLLPLVAAWLIGDNVLSRRAYLAAVAEQAEQRGRIEAERTRRAAREERVRIARELHDVVAHSLTVITVQAGVSQFLMAEQPEQAHTALQSIEEIARGAQNELRVVLGLLRDADSERAELAPAPGLKDLAGLVETLRGAGTPVELRISGTEYRLSAALELTLYRVVQEALTNVVRHAPGESATVELEIAPGRVRVVVENDLPMNPASGSDSESDVAQTSGHGIAGMRERVAAFGGSFDVEQRADCFRVSAMIPVEQER